MVSGEDFDVIQSHFARDVGVDFVSLEAFVNDFDNKMSVGKSLDDDPGRSNIFLLRQAK